MTELDASMVAALRRLGLVTLGARVTATPLAGGVASDIWRVEAGDRTFVVKRALPKLRVTADWRVPVSRNASEVEWFRTVGGIAPDAVPSILGHDAEAGLFAMTYLPATKYPVWKEQLRRGNARPDFASAIGATLSRIHAATAAHPEIAGSFGDNELFDAIRLEPYLEATAARHPELSARLLALSATTLRTRIALVHGDVSPKNILVGANGPIFLDAECAWFGDPAFDIAFCLNHLLLKCLWVPSFQEQYLACFDALAASYLTGVNWEPSLRLEARAARLVAALLLGRIDGKSPVEYLTDERAKTLCREVAAEFILAPADRLATIRERWSNGVSGYRGKQDG